jgi:superfamily I DNA/RNA helicase
VHWHTFLSWCWRNRPAEISRREVVTYRQRRQLLTQAWHAHLADTAVSEPMLAEEIDWLKDRLIFGRADYLAADRAGRGFALSEPLRQKVYDAMESYHKSLRQRRLLDWGDIPRQLWVVIQRGEARLPLYDSILVDEAQFFAPLWFEIIKKILKPGSGHLFMVADPSQGFLRRRQSWLTSGLDVRGRAHRLNKSYRTTREILDFATLLYRTRLPDDDEGEEIIAPDLLDMPTGAVPVVVPLTSPQDELTRVVNEIKELASAGIPLGHILAIHADWHETGRLIERLCRELGPGAAVDPGRADDSAGRIRVCSLHAATGLEAPIVFLMGVHALYQEEQSVRLSDAERAELIRDNTRKLYMACTRAGQRLVLTYVGDAPEMLAQAIGPPETIS